MPRVCAYLHGLNTTGENSSHYTANPNNKMINVKMEGMLSVFRLPVSPTIYSLLRTPWSNGGWKLAASQTDTSDFKILTKLLKCQVSLALSGNSNHFHGLFNSGT